LECRPICGVSARGRTSEPEIGTAVTLVHHELGSTNGAPRRQRSRDCERCQAAAELSDQIARQLDVQHYDQRFTLQLMRNIVEDGETIAQQGERAAEQAHMSLDSLFNAYQQNIRSANDGDIQAAISGLLQQFNNPSAYSAPRFAAQMQKVQSALTREGSLTGSGK
jgi:hypothetical protein